jgi:pSer/pThr/pTyr-binding forkhead associated (FHA) protein
MRAQLVALDGGPPVEITRDITVIGRKEGCDVHLNHKSVSKLHCVLVKTDGLILLRDLGSTNGTRVNGKRIRRAALLPNDLVNIAGFGFRVLFGPTDMPVSPSEQTQQIDAAEVGRLLQQAADSHPDSAPPRQVVVKVNTLPDAYSGDEDKEKQHSGVRE